MLLIGLTGGIGSGKSTVATLLERKGALIVDGDRIARQIVEPGQPALKELVEEFGPQILLDDGCLNRAGLARLAFATPQATARLNAIMHPRIHEACVEQFRAAPPDAVVVFDMPLLVENNLARWCAATIVVTADTDVRVDRLVRYRGLDADDARRRMDAQLADADRAVAADVVIDNSGPREVLDAVVDRLWEHRVWPWAQWAHGGNNPHRGFEDEALARPARMETSESGVTRVRVPYRQERIVARVACAVGADPDAVGVSGDVEAAGNGRVVVTVPHGLSGMYPHPAGFGVEEALQYLGFTRDPGPGCQWVCGDPYNPVLLLVE